MGEHFFKLFKKISTKKNLEQKYFFCHDFLLRSGAPDFGRTPFGPDRHKANEHLSNRPLTTKQATRRLADRQFAEMFG